MNMSHVWNAFHSCVDIVESWKIVDPVFSSCSSVALVILLVLASNSALELIC